MRSVLTLVMAALLTLSSATPAFAEGPIHCLAFPDPSIRLLPAPRIFSDAVGIREINIKPLPIPATKADPAFNQSVLTILGLLAGPIFESGSLKETLDRGELKLGAPLGDGSSVEFEYRGDKRASDMVLRLNRIILYKPNGQSINIDRNPVSDNGRTLITKPITLIDSFKTNADGERILKEMKVLDLEGLTALADKHEFLATALNEKRASTPLRTVEAVRDLLSASDLQALVGFDAARLTIQVPVTIEGALMTELEQWLKRLPNVSRDELRQAATGEGLRSLAWKAGWRRNSSYIWDKIIVKQSFKIPLVLLTFWGLSALATQMGAFDINRLNTWMPHSSAVDKTIQGSATVMGRPEYKTVREVLDGLKLPETELQAFEAKAREDINAVVQRNNTIRALENMRDELTKNDAEESVLGGSPRYYPDKGGTVSAGLFPNWKSGYMLVHYPLQKKVLLIPVSNVGDIVPSAVVLNIKERNYPEIYKGLTERTQKKP